VPPPLTVPSALGEALTVIVLLRVDGQRRKAGRVPLAVGRVVEIDAIYVSIGLEVARVALTVKVSRM
jgi:hypothetical protein